MTRRLDRSGALRLVDSTGPTDVAHLAHGSGGWLSTLQKKEAALGPQEDSELSDVLVARREFGDFLSYSFLSPVPQELRLFSKSAVMSSGVAKSER